MQAFNSIEAVQFGFCHCLLQTISLGLLPRHSQKLKKLEKEGQKRLEKSFDLVALIKQQRAVSALLRLLLSKHERRLLKFQRKEVVIEVKGQDSSESDESSIRE